MIQKIVRVLVKRSPQLKLKLKMANLEQTPFQYVFQTLTLTFLTYFFCVFFLVLVLRQNILYLAVGITGTTLLISAIYMFWFRYVDTKIKKLSRELDNDLVFVSEYFLILLESGFPLGNIIERISKLKRPGGEFFKRIYLEFLIGTNLEKSIDNAISYAPNYEMKVLLKKIKDNLELGADLERVLQIFIKDSSEKKSVENREYAKKLNPLITIYLLLGVVLPSLGTTFFILGATFLDITPTFLNLILSGIFVSVVLFQYFSYSGFKFVKMNL